MASDRLVKFAAGVNAGKSARDAALTAGYSTSYASTHAAPLMRQARDAGLLMSEDAVRRAAEQVERKLTDHDTLEAMLEALIAKAVDGDVGALRTVFERVFGGVPQSVHMNQSGGINITFGYDGGGDDSDAE